MKNHEKLQTQFLFFSKYHVFHPEHVAYGSSSSGRKYLDVRRITWYGLTSNLTQP